jgi:6-phosphofructokinase 1
MPPWPARPTFIVGDWHGVYVHLPIPLAVASRKKIDPESDLWHAVIAATGQPQTWD